jgi:type IVB pilus formation R64 PilN family outer membrane protein
MPGASDYSVGRASSSSTGSSGGVEAVSKLEDDQHSNLKGSLSVWKDLQSTLNSLKSKDGMVTVSESTTTAMIHDHPSNARAMEQYIDQLNHELSKQVELQVKVMQVQLDTQHQFGIDWSNVAAHVLRQTLSLSGTLSDAINLGTSGGKASGNGLVSFKVADKSGKSDAVISALGTQGVLSMVTEPTVTTLNNQVAEVRITRDTSYLEKAEISTTAIGGSTSSSLTPGIVTDGFTLYILPKIQNSKIYLNVSSTLSTLQSWQTINNQGVIGSGAGTPSSTGNIMTIQVPTLAEKRFNVRSVVTNGETLIVAGFKQTENQAQLSRFLDSEQLGARGAAKNNIETVVLITPIIIENKD